MDPIISIYPENNKQLIKRSLVLYRRGFKHVILFSVLMSLIVFLPRFLTSYGVKNDITEVMHFTVSQLWLLVLEMFSLVCFIAIVWHMHCVELSKREPMLEDIRVGLKKVLMVIVAAIIQSIIFIMAVTAVFGLQLMLAQYQNWFFANPLGLFLITAILIAEFFVLIYIASLFIFLIPIIAIENKGIFSALKRSILIVWNHWWRTVSLQILPWLCYFFILMTLRYLLGVDLGIYFISTGSPVLWISILHFVLFAIFIPWVAALLVVQLHDLELRNRLASTT